MSRGRKPNQKAVSIDWSSIFKKNAGKYFNIILAHLGSFREVGDGNGIEVLNEIEKEKGRRKLKDKPFQKLTIDEIPYKIPENWVWCRLGQMSINRDGERNPISLLDRNNREKIYDYYGASGVIDKIDGYTHEGELLLISEDGANLLSRSTPIAFIARGKYWVNNHAHVLETVHRITLDYLKCYINSIDIKPFVTGGFQPKLSQGNLNIIPIPLPPISFQEKFIEFISDFENNKIKSNDFYFNKQIEKKIIELHKSQLSAAEMIIENDFQLSQLENLNQAILQEAVQGKLVKQNPRDEPATELLKRIKIEKAKSGKKEMSLPPINPKEIPFEIPENWVWCRLGEVIEYTDNLDIQKKLSHDTIINYVDIDAIDNQNFVIRESKQKKVKELSTRARRILKPNFIVYSTVRPYLKNIAVIKEELENHIGSTGFNVFKTLNVELKYVFYYLLTPYVNNSFKDLMVGFNSPSITNEQFEKSLFPLPPLSEQKSIVEKIEKQLAKTKKLKEHILDNQQATEQLLKALLHQAFEGE